MLLCVKTTSGSRQRNAGPVSSQVAVNSRWKANSWICSVISGLCLPPDSWNVCDDKRRPRHPYPAQHAYTDAHARHTYCGMQSNWHVQEDNKPCLLLSLWIYVVKQQNTFYPNLSQITSNIPPWIDSLYFVISVMYYTLFSLKGVSKKKIHLLAVYYSFGEGWMEIPMNISDFQMIKKNI